MSNIKKLVNHSVRLEHDLKRFLEMYKDVEDNTNQSALSVEERSDFNLLYQIQDKIGDAYFLLDKLNKDVKAAGYLEKNVNDRYEVNGMELTSGSYVEFYWADDDGGCYVPSRLEHSGQDYYIVALGRDKLIQGLQVRIK